MRELVIAGRRISDDDPCYVIAEIGHNHGGLLTTARQMVREAAQCGASAAKFQKRDNANLYSRALLDAPYANENSYGLTYGQHRDYLEFNEEDYRELLKQSPPLPVFATAFDEKSADVLMRLGMPAIKIHSGGLTDESLVRHVAAYHKPVILSTGGGTLGDIDRAVMWLRDCPYAILHCTASYPLNPKEANLLVIGTLRQRYPETVIGWSSHHPGIALSLAAYTLGARIIEHHFTLNRASKGTDHAFSLEPKGLQTLVEDLEKIRQALGDGIKVFYDSEKGPTAKMRRVVTAEGLKITGQLVSTWLPNQLV